MYVAASHWRRNAHFGDVTVIAADEERIRRGTESHRVAAKRKIISVHCVSGQSKAAEVSEVSTFEPGQIYGCEERRQRQATQGKGSTQDKTTVRHLPVTSRLLGERATSGVT